ncbi:MAG: response regulator transcription factor [Xanthomonadaceae bacterium]|nr:response regulator transcription factor [Xanthomonadaceae bacterium]
MPTKSLRSVLVIEDETALREFFVFDLEAAGFQVLAAPDGEVATQILSTADVDLVVTDANVPKKTGIQILQELRTRKDPGRPSVALITGNLELRLEDAYHLGINIFIQKPFNRQLLLDAAKRHSLPARERWLFNVATKQLPAWKTVGELEINLESYEDSVKKRLVHFGQGGMFIAIEDAAVKVGEAIGFKIHFQNEKGAEIKGEGIVRWGRLHSLDKLPAGIGVEIYILDPVSIITYEKILKKYNPIPFIPKG